MWMIFVAAVYLHFAIGTASPTIHSDTYKLNSHPSLVESAYKLILAKIFWNIRLVDRADVWHSEVWYISPSRDKFDSRATASKEGV